jgi:predicted MFS family arabinose efflux permease
MLGGLTMASAGAGSPSWIAAILEWRWTWVANTFLEYLGLIAGFVLVAIMPDRSVANISLGKGVG